MVGVTQRSRDVGAIVDNAAEGWSFEIRAFKIGLALAKRLEAQGIIWSSTVHVAPGIVGI